MRPVGHAMLAVLVAFAFACLLNAHGLRKTAQTQPSGYRRDAALALTAPLVSVSEFLHLDRPRSELQAAVGRSGDDTIVTSFPSLAVLPTVGGPTSSLVYRAHGRTHRVRPRHVAPPVPAKEAFSPGRPLRIYVAGDSLSIIPGLALMRVAAATPVLHPVAAVDGHISTGLERPDVFDWFGEIRSRVLGLRPDVVVLTFGANDDHSYMTGLPAGTSIDGFGTASWVAEYRRRVAAVMDSVTAGSGRFLVWIGLPITRDSDRNGRYRLMNRIYAQEAAKRAGRVAYVDAYRLFQDRSGGYAAYLPTAGGGLALARSGDGIHYEWPGGERLAAAVVSVLHRQFDLTSWRRPHHTPKAVPLRARTPKKPARDVAAGRG